MKLPRIDTFKLPVSPSHVATAAGLALTAALPGLSGETRGIGIASVTLGYVFAECLYVTFHKKELEVPIGADAEANAIRARLRELGQ